MSNINVVQSYWNFAQLSKSKNKQIAKIWDLQLEKQKSGPKISFPEGLENTPFTIISISGFGVEFSPSFAQDGFCVSNKDGPVLMQSHALCFYEDTIFAILVWVLVNIIGKNMIPETDVALMTRYEFIRWFHKFSVTTNLQICQEIEFV